VADRATWLAVIVEFDQDWSSHSFFLSSFPFLFLSFPFPFFSVPLSRGNINHVESRPSSLFAGVGHDSRSQGNKLLLIILFIYFGSGGLTSCRP